MRRKRQRNTEESDIDITPMMDVVFIMLIFFIVLYVLFTDSGSGCSKFNKENITEIEHLELE